MANADKKPNPQEYDYSKYAQLYGVDPGDLRSIEALMPAYVPKLAFEQKWEPVVGEGVRIHIANTRNEGQNDEQTPVGFEMKLKAATKAAFGNEVSGYNIVDRKAGESVIVWASGAMIRKRELWLAFVNPLVMQAMIFRCTGQSEKPLKPGQNRMWEWDQKFIENKGTPVTVKRENQFLLTENDINARKLVDVVRLANGEVLAKDVFAKWDQLVLGEAQQGRGLAGALPQAPSAQA